MTSIITGSPGVGKHTVTKKIAEMMKYKILDVNKIALDSGFFEDANETKDVDVKKLGRFIKSKITKRTLIVGHLAPYVVSKNQIKTVIVLRKNPYQLLKVYKKRKYSKKKIFDNIGSEILGTIAFDSIKKFGKNKTFHIDTSSKSTQTTIKKIQTAFNGKFENDKIDWLYLVSKRNDLKKFFSYRINNVTNSV